MDILMYLFTLIAFIVSLVTAFIHLLGRLGANWWKRDSGTFHRRRSWWYVLLHFAVTGALFFACAHYAKIVIYS